VLPKRNSNKCPLASEFYLWFQGLLRQSIGDLHVCRHAVCHLGVSRKSLFGPFYTLWDPIFYAHAKFGENTLIGGTRYAPKTEFEKTFSCGGILLPVPTLMPGTTMCGTMQNFSQSGQSAAKLWRFYLFTLWVSFWLYP